MALAAVTVSARRRGLPQHRGQTPEPAKRRRRRWLMRLPTCRRSRRSVLSGLADLFPCRRVMIVCDALCVGAEALGA
jgi:hypothetical protein